MGFARITFDNARRSPELNTVRKWSPGAQAAFTTRDAHATGCRPLLAGWVGTERVCRCPGGNATRGEVPPHVPSRGRVAARRRARGRYSTLSTTHQVRRWQARSEAPCHHGPRRPPQLRADRSPGCVCPLRRGQRRQVRNVRHHTHSRRHHRRPPQPGPAQPHISPKRPAHRTGALWPHERPRPPAHQSRDVGQPRDRSRPLRRHAARSQLGDHLARRRIRVSRRGDQPDGPEIEIRTEDPGVVEFNPPRAA